MTYKEKLRMIPLFDTKKCEGCKNSVPTFYNWYCCLKNNCKPEYRD
jgi:hypothetical protein